MGRSIIGLGALSLIGVGAQSVLAGGRCGTSCTSTAQAGAAKGSCSSDQATASCESAGGKIAGHFDPAMSGVCRFACATRLKYKTADVLAQPGAKAEKLTQCPV